ncbi:MAG: hypothetical protein II026_06305 [Bacteroidales bacterium]|nr:hypothetical protein [Bacteroidales bacterium]MBQ4012479.1 hypothetical protein [Bacteroidales bacterium]
MKKYNFFKTDGKMPSQEQLLYTQLFYRNAPEIYAHFDEWKDNDRFYFIPLYLQMTYSCGWVAEVAPDPVWLGSFVRCTLEHPDLFQYQCPSCGNSAPLSLRRFPTQWPHHSGLFRISRSVAGRETDAWGADRRAP